MKELILKLNRKWLLLGLLVLLIPAFFVYYFFFRGGERVHPRRGPVTVAVYSLGTVTSDNIFNFKAGLTASIVDLPVHEGDPVQKGQRLFTLDSGAVVTAPFAGVITRIGFQRGEILMPGTPVLTIVDMKNRHVTVSLDQESAVRVKPGQIAEVSFETMRGQQFKGVVDRLYPQTGQFLATIKVELPPDILPEMTADVAIATGRNENSLLVPVSAIVDSTVIRVRDHRQQKVKVETGAADGDWIEITGNVLTDTDEVLLQKK